jgi:hypothetical protein
MSDEAPRLRVQGLAHMARDLACIAGHDPEGGLTEAAQTLTVRVPFTIRKRGGRKLVIAPGGSETAPVRHRVDNAMVKALARGFRWRKMLETGVYGTIEDLATAEKTNCSYISRILWLTLLAPVVVDAVCQGHQPPCLTLGLLIKPFPIEWHEQARKLLADK